MAMNCTHTNNPPDAQYCIDCGAVLLYTGNTQRLVEEMQRPSASIAASIKYDDIEIKQSNTDPRTWSIHDFGKPLYVTRKQLYEMLSDVNLFSAPYASYVEIGAFISNERRKICVNRGIYYTYYGREIIIINE